MKKKNYMAKITYWLEILLVSIVLGVMFYFWGFRNCFSLDRKASLILYLLLCLFTEIPIGYFAGLKSRGNVSIWCTAIMPLELYSLIVYGQSQLWRVIVLIILWLLALLTFYLIKVHRSMGEETKTPIRDFPIFIRAGWIIGVLVFLIFLFPILSRGAVGVEVSLDYTIKDTSATGLTITSQMDTLSQFDTDIWKKLERKQKESLLQLVADIECNSLGLSRGINIGIRDFGESTVKSCYTAADYKILIDEDTLMTATGMELIEMICHQAYHSYERNIVDLYMNSSREYQSLKIFQNVEDYIAELQKDIQAIDDRSGAANEHLEADAKAYAEEELDQYSYWIEFWKGTQS